MIKTIQHILSLKGICILILMLLFSNLNAQDDQDFIKIFTKSDGLPSNTLYNIIQGPKGFLWIATEEGLSRFDGNSFKTFISPEMKDFDVLRCQVDSKGDIWFRNLSLELFKLSSGKQEKINIPEKYGAHSLYIAGDKVWMGSVNGSYLRLNLNGEIEKIYFDDKSFNHAIASITSIDDNDVMVSSQDYLIRNFHNSDDFELIKMEGKDHYFMEHFNRDTILAYNRKINCNLQLVPSSETYSNKIKRVLNKLAANNIRLTSVVKIEDKFYLCSTKGIFILNKQLNLENEAAWLSDYNVNYLLKDFNNNFWITTHNNGLIKVSSQKIKVHLTENSDLNSKEIYSIVEDQKQGIIIGMSDYIQPFNGSNFQKAFPVKKERSRILSMENDNENTLWIGGDSELVAVELTPEIKPKKIKLRNNDVKSFLHTKDYFYYGNAFSLGLIENDSTEVLLRERVNQIFKSRSGTIYIGTHKGLFTVERKNVSKVDLGKFSDEHISGITELDNTIFLATSGNGIFTLNDKVKHYNTNNILSSNSITCLYGDEVTKSLWAGTNSGLIQIKNDRSVILNSFNDLNTNEINCIYKYKDKIFAGSNNGLIEINAESDFTSNKNDKVFIDEVLLDNKLISNKTEFRHFENNFIFKFSSLSFNEASKPSYMYRLTNVEKDWIKTDNNSVSYPTLPAGDYTFSIGSLSELNKEPENITNWSFSIKKAFYNTWWFRFLVMGVIAFFTYLIVNERLKNVRDKREFQLELNKKVADLKLQTLRAQMNPHFIFNAMNSIQSFVLNNQKETALKYLNVLSSLIRKVFEYSEQDKIRLDREIQFLEMYINLEKMRFGDKIDIHLSIDENLDVDMLEIPPMIIQPLIENAFRHGLMHKDKDGKLFVSFKKLSEEQMQVVIEDNGIGRKAAEEKNAWKRKSDKPSGLKVTAERIDLLKNNPDYSPELITTDLYDSHNAPAGTKVELTLNI